jgi:hypothetical protein
MDVIDEWRAKNNPTACLIFSELTCRRLPPFPEGVKWISIWNMTLDELPPIPESVTRLTLWHVRLDELPPLPYNLEVLALAYTTLRILPRMPCMNKWKHYTCQLYTHENPNLLIPRGNLFSYEYADLWNQWWSEQEVSQLRVTKRCVTIKDELLAVTWHTDRIRDWCVEVGGLRDWDSV